jgi:tetratricopeptide (TPR) repeat protein
MRILLACAAIALAAALPAPPAAAHDEYLTRHEAVRLTPAQAQRVAELERRAMAPALRGIAAVPLARAVAQLGNCTLAEDLLRGLRLPPQALLSAVQPAIGGPDRACAERVLRTVTAAARTPGPDNLDPSALYQAGILWRRLGKEEQARAAIEEAERRFDAEEARLGDRLWSCHGGDCITQRWFVRINALRLLHGTPQWSTELRRLAASAAPGLTARPDEEPRAYIGQRVYEELVWVAAAHGDEDVGLVLAAGTVHRTGGRSYYAARMHALLREGRTAEAIALLPRAGRAFWSADAHLVADNLEAFAAQEGFYDHFRHRFDLGSLAIVRALMERGAFDQARTLIEAARSGSANAGSRPPGYAEMEGLAAFLEHRRDAARHLARLARRTGPRSRESELAELALFLASRGDWLGFEGALAEVRHRPLRARILAELPCRAAAGGEAEALAAIRRIGAIGPRRGADEDERSEYGDSVYQTFRCLLRRDQGDAAIAYAEAIRPVRLKLSILSGLPVWSSLSQPTRIRRRLADLALAHAERHGLWGEEAAVETSAADYERLGDYAAADRILERVEGDERRARLLIKLIESYVPEIEHVS